MSPSVPPKEETKLVRTGRAPHHKGAGPPLNEGGELLPKSYLCETVGSWQSAGLPAGEVGGKIGDRRRGGV